MEQDQRSNALVTGSVGRLMGRYAVPCVISLLVAALYNIVDQIFIANAAYLGSYGNAIVLCVAASLVLTFLIAVFLIRSTYRTLSAP